MATNCGDVMKGHEAALFRTGEWTKACCEQGQRTYHCRELSQINFSQIAFIQGNKMNKLYVNKMTTREPMNTADGSNVSQKHLKLAGKRNLMTCSTRQFGKKHINSRLAS